MPVTIRKARPSDIPTIHAMIRTLSAFHGETATITLEQLQEAFFAPTPRAQALVALIGDRPVGYAGICQTSSLHEKAPRYDINHLFVAEPERGKGIGKALVGEATRLARERGAQRLTIGTAPANKAAQAAYRAMGLQEITDPGPRFRIPL